jgi:cytochrome P450
MASATRQRIQRAAQNAIGFGFGSYERLRCGIYFNPFSASFRRDPYPFYRSIRERTRVYAPALGGSVLLTHYDDIVAMLRDDRFSADDRNSRNWDRIRSRDVKKGLIAEEDSYQPSMLRSDDPDHLRLRTLVSKAFTPRALSKLSHRIEEIVGEHIDTLRGQQSVDLMSSFAAPVPIVVIAEMLGVPPDDRERFKHWSDEVVLQLGANTLEEARRARRANDELNTYFGKIAEMRRSEPRDDLISALLLAEEEGDKLSLEEVFASCQLLLVAGNETTTNLIGNGLYALLRNPSELEKLRDQPELIDGAVEEALRYDSPVQATSRHPLEDVEIAGTPVPKGVEVLAMLAAANRDPNRYPDPDRFDIERNGEPHLSFSTGVHFCLGASLARLEARHAISMLVQAFPQLKLADPEPPYRRNLILRGLQRLPVSLG